MTLVASENRPEEQFSLDVANAFDTQDVKKLSDPYKSISEESDINKAKQLCGYLFKHCTDTILNVIKSDDNSAENISTKYYAWHFLQLMSCHPPLKLQLENDESILPMLIKFNKIELSQERQLSLRKISLNFIVYLLGDATDDFYDLIASSKTVNFLYELLQHCSMGGEDELFEIILLAINLLVEGTISCKKLLTELSFDILLSEKIKNRLNCNEELLNIANLTFQKLVLLRSNDKSFQEEFRKNFQKEADKQIIYQSAVCSNEKCLGDNIDMDVVLKRCSRCKLTNYCSKECQRTHWKSSHSKTCIPHS